MNTMKLSEQETSQFFQLMLPLQYYVNQTENLIENISTFKDYLSCEQHQKFFVRNWLFDHIDLIDEYERENPFRLDEAELSIIRSWKNFVIDDFIIERYLKKYVILIKNDDVYGVLSLKESLDQIIDKSLLPHYAKMILLPFNGKIVYDGFLQSHKITFNSNIKNALKERYLTAKENGIIITDLLADVPEVKGPDKKKIRRMILEFHKELTKIEEDIEKSDLTAMEANVLMNLLKTSFEFVDHIIESKDISEFEKHLKKMRNAIDKIVNQYF